MIHDRLKKIIFRKLYEDLSKVEIIPYKDSIWLIDRENKYWYFEYKKSGTLWWRYTFFENFFSVFSLERDEYEPLISEWVEEVLNCKVTTPDKRQVRSGHLVEEVLNCKVTTPQMRKSFFWPRVEEVLNCKINRHVGMVQQFSNRVEEILNYKVNLLIDNNE